MKMSYAERKAQRMAEDKAKLLAPETWPWPPEGDAPGLIYLKLQPWVVERPADRIGACLGSDAPLHVALLGPEKGSEDFNNVDELVERWSVD
jgi:hypothetical protein